MDYLKERSMIMMENSQRPCCMTIIIDQDADHSLQFNPGRRGKRLRDFFLSKEKIQFLIILVFDNLKVY